MKAIVLARVSTEEQKEAGNSLPAQQERLRNYIKRNNLELVKEFIFDESAAKENRKEFAKVVNYLKEQKEPIALCCDKIDRLSRDFLVGIVELEKLRREGRIELHFASDGINRIHKDSNAGELFVFNVLVAASQNYSNSISDNTKRAFEQKRRIGEITGPAPLGYKSIPLDPKKRTRSNVIPDPESAHIVQQLFAMYATGNYSVSDIWQEAIRLGLKRKGNPISRSSIGDMLTKTFYYGMAYSKVHDYYYPHRYECLITKELFDQCEKVRTGRRQQPTQTSGRKPFILRGLLTCKKCGCLLSPEIKKGKYIYYSCSNAKGICNREYILEEELLKPIYAVFEAMKDIPVAIQEKIVGGLRTLNEGQVAFHKRETQRIQRDYNKSQERIDGLVDLLIDKSITKDVYDKKLQELKDKQYNLGLQLEEYTKANHEYHIHVNTVLDLCRRVPEIFESSEIEEKRAIINFLLQNSVVDGRKLEFTMRKPFDTVLQVAQHPDLLRGLDSNQ